MALRRRRHRARGRRRRHPYTLSTMATASIERIAREAGGRLWFQAYIFRQRDMTLGLVERARQFGYEALMVTVDVPVGASASATSATTLRFASVSPRETSSISPAAVVGTRILRHGMPVLENVVGLARKRRAPPRSPPRRAVLGCRFRLGRAEGDARPVAGRMLVKGVLRADDAARLASIGVDAVVVSNHGGRSSTGGRGARCSSAYRARSQGRISVLVDGECAARGRRSRRSLSAPRA